MKKTTVPYWVFPTKLSNIDKHFEFLHTIMQIKDKGFKTRKEIAMEYERQQDLRTLETCLNYINVLEHLGIVNGAFVNYLRLTDFGQQAYELYCEYLKNESEETLDMFRGIVLMCLCSNYKVSVENRSVYPFSSINYFMSKMYGEMYDIELLMLMLTSDNKEIDEVISFSQKLREVNFDKDLVADKIQEIKYKKGLTNKDFEHIVRKLLCVPKAFLETLGVIEKQQETFVGEPLIGKVNINYNSKIKLKR